MKTIACVAAAVVLSGCALMQPDPRVVAFEAGKKTINIDPRLLAECPDLEKLKDSGEAELLKANEQWFLEYKACKEGKAKLNKMVKGAFNIDEEPKKETK